MENKTVEVFNNEDQAMQAIYDLKNQGIPERDIHVLAKDDDYVNTIQDSTDVAVETGFTQNPENRGMLDNLISMFKGDDIGYYSSAEVENRLLQNGIPESQIQLYKDDFDQGKILVMVDSPYDTSLRNDGTLMNSDAGYNTDSQEKAVPLREERLNVDKDHVQAGEVQLHKDVVAEERTINVPVEHEEVYIERRPARGNASTEPIQEGETLHIPVSEERINVTKEPVVTDEIVIGKRKVSETQQVSDTVKKEQIHLDQTGNPIIRGNDFRAES